MCGLSGLLDRGRSHSPEALTELALAMADAVGHRGPDDRGAWADADAGVALGHRRLAVIDRSERGHQPMVSPSGRHVVAYNGEIYNFRQLRAELESTGWRFRGGSDTEVLLAAVERWGLDGALRRCNGMFAFALWDGGDRRLHLVRDRFGEKPLYYAWVGDVLLFGSELKALRAHPGFRPAIDRDALALYLRHNCVPAPRTIYRDVAKLAPGAVLTVAAGDPSPPVVRSHWSAGTAVEAARAAPLDGGDEELADELEALLGDAVALRLEADVPVGAFLSGGVDSSLVTALMQARSGRARTFTIGFDDPAYDESRDAARVAAHLGTDHTELRVSPGEAMAVIPLLPELYDEPFGDSSQIPTALLSRLARRDVTVALSGDAGDELFAGYNRYAWCHPLRRWQAAVPRPVRSAVGGALGAVPQAGWDAVFRAAAPLAPPRLRLRNPGTKLQKLADVLPAGSADETYLRLVSHWKDPASVVLGAADRAGAVGVPPGLDDPVERMMYRDLVTYLPDDILVKLDRASMGVGLEARVPLLDHRVVEFAWRLPLDVKLRGRQGKWLLRRVLHRYVPPELVDRPKAGFGLPIGSWLRGPLRPWAEDLLDEGRLRREGFLAPGAVRRAWSGHLAGRDAAYRLWDVLMFQSWLEHTGCR